MSVLQWVGVALVVIGVAELGVFRVLATHRENIRRRMPLLVANSALNVVLGVSFFAFG